MKKLCSVVASFLLFIGVSKAQQPNGTLAADFNMQDIKGDYYQLYNYLDSGKYVIIDFFGTHCGPCWNYHKTRALNKAYKKWGPSGEKKLMIFMIEIDGSPDSIIRGKGNDNPNWEDSTDFPILHTHIPNPLPDVLIEDYGIFQEPTVYMICPDKRTRYLGFPPPDTTHIRYSYESCPSLSYITTQLDFAMLDSIKSFFCTNNVKPSLRLQNNGIDTINSFKYYIYLNNILNDSVSWAGIMKTYKVLRSFGGNFTNLNPGENFIKYKIKEINDSIMPATTDSLIFRFNVLTDQRSLPFAENFTSQYFPYSEWTITGSSDYYPTFSRVVLPYCNALLVPFEDIPADAESWLVLPKIDFSGNQTPLLSFKVATSYYRAEDYIMIFSSNDCGKNLDFIVTYATSQMKTAPDGPPPFVPDSTQWKTINIPLPTLAGKANTIIEIKGKSGQNNNVYLRDIRIDNTASIKDYSLENDVAVYPNPFSDIITIVINEVSMHHDLILYDLTGRIISNTSSINNNHIKLDLGNLPKGAYFLNIKNENMEITKKIIKL